tara:strand:- start:209 stop:796 length:588 start_codon:yes stop_codon:yes gene_type:complete
MTITLRNTKGSALTFNELDGNFTDLVGRIESLPDSAQVLGLIDSAYINLRSDFDSAETLILIDANALDSGRATKLIDSAYINFRTNKNTDSAETIKLIEGNSLDSARALVQINSLKLLDSNRGLALIDANALDSGRGRALIDAHALDSGRAIGLIDSNYVSDRVDSAKFISLAQLKTEVAASADFGAFKSRIAAL